MTIDLLARVLIAGMLGTVPAAVDTATEPETVTITADIANCHEDEVWLVVDGLVPDGFVPPHATADARGIYRVCHPLDDLTTSYVPHPADACMEDEDWRTVDHRTAGAVEVNGVSRMCVHVDNN